MIPGNRDLTLILSDLASSVSEPILDRLQVSASTQNQALRALLFLYREVLNLDMAGIDAVRAKRPQYVPTVLTKEEAIAKVKTQHPQETGKLEVITVGGILAPDQVIA